MDDKTRAAFEAVAHGDLVGVMTTVGTNANLLDDQGRTLLATAILKRERPILLILLQRGADPNARTESGRSPHLHFAIQTGTPGSGGIEIAELLIQHGADVGGTDEAGNSVLHIAAQAGPMPLYAAYMTRYLVGAGASVHAVNRRGETPLHLAVTTIARETVKILCQHGARVDQPDHSGKSPLRTAAEFWADDDEHRHLVDDYTRLLSEIGARDPSQP